MKFFLLLLTSFSLLAFADEKKTILFLHGKPSHGCGAHEHRAGNMLLAKRLNESGLVKAIVHSEIGYPTDKKVLEKADSIVFFCTGLHGHLLNSHLDEFDKYMKQGKGLIMIHWSTEAKKGKPGDKFLEWMGGFCDLNWSVNPHWEANFKDFPKHPICNGVEPFSVNDEWYYHMRFTEDKKNLTPILFDLPPKETLKRKDGSRSGNPHVRKAIANGEVQTVGWAYERPYGGRAFATTGGHYHKIWQSDGFRKIMLNAILWTAKAEVPAQGLDSPTPDDKEIDANLDDKSPRKKK